MSTTPHHPPTLLLCTDPGVPLLGPSGASAHLRGVARALAASGPVHIAVSRLEDHRGSVRDPVEQPTTTVAPRSWGWVPRRWREWGEILDGRRLLDRALAELSHPPMLVWERHSLFGDAGARSGLPRVVELNAPLSAERARYGRVLSPDLARRVEARSLRSADRVVAVSAWLAAWAVDEVGCEPGRVVHVPNGVEDRGPGHREITRASLGLEGLVVGFVGTMRPWHGVERLPALLDALPEATALVVGDGPAPPPAHPRLVQLGRVVPDRLPHVVAAMDVGLAPYGSDAPPWFCPLKILEYLSQGVPVVAADLGDARHLLGPGGGEVVPGDDVRAWAAAIRRQATTPRTPRVRTWGTVVREALHGMDLTR